MSVHNDPSIKQLFGAAFGAVGKEIKSKFDSFKAKLPDKDTVKQKFTKDNMAKVGEGLKNGTVKALKKTAGAFLVGLSMITPKKTSDKLAPKGMELMTGSKVGEGYGAYKREKVGLQAKKMLGKAMQGLGKGLEKIGQKIAMHEKVDFNSKTYKAARFIESKGSGMKFEGEYKTRGAKRELEGLKEKRPEPQENRSSPQVGTYREKAPSDTEMRFFEQAGFFDQEEDPGVVTSEERDRLGSIQEEIDSQHEEPVSHTGSHVDTTSVGSPGSQDEEHVEEHGSGVDRSSVETPRQNNPFEGQMARLKPVQGQRDRSAPNLDPVREEKRDQQEQPSVTPHSTGTSTPTGPKGGGSLLDDIRKRPQLKKTETDDRSAPQVGGDSKTGTPSKKEGSGSLQDTLANDPRFQALGRNRESSGKGDPQVEDDDNDDWLDD